MLDIIESADSTDCLVQELPAATPESHNQLGEAITNLWVAHANAKIAARLTNEELRALRAKLGEQLHEMKGMLAKPGCDGQWSAFLRERQIPRATADRLAARHLRSLNPDMNCVTEEIYEPTDEEVQRLFASMWPRLRRRLRSQRSVDLFVRLLTSHCQHSEPTVHEIPLTMAATVTFGPACSDADSFVESDLDAAPVARAVEELI